MTGGENATGRKPGGGRSGRLDAGLRAAFGGTARCWGKPPEAPSVVEAPGEGRTRELDLARLRHPANLSPTAQSMIATEMATWARLFARSKWTMKESVEAPKRK